MKARLVRIGNSRGLRLSKPLLEQAGLTDEVDVTVEPGLLSIRPIANPRAGWAASAASRPPDGLFDEPTSSRFDEAEWTW